MKRAKFAGLTVLLGALIVEGAARLMLGGTAAAARAVVLEQPGGPPGAPTLLPDFMRAEVIHPYLGTIPNQVTPQDDLGFGLSVSPVQKRSPKKLLVAVTGGSVAHLMANQAGSVLTKALARAHPGKEIVLLKLAVPGFKQPQALMTLSYLLTLGAEFDVVINVDGYNELALAASENVPHGVFAAFPRMWHLRAQGTTNSATLRLLGLQALAQERRRRWAAFMPAHRSAAAAIVWLAGDRFLEGNVAAYRYEISTGGARASTYVGSGPRRQYASKAAMYEDLAGIWERSSRLMGELCRARGIRYVHVLQPNQYVPGSKTLTAQERKVAWTPANASTEAVEGGYPLLRKAGARLSAGGVRFVDASGLFRGVKESLYVDSCCHFNERGSALLAEAAAREAAR